MIEGGLDDFGVDPSERETMPPESEPTNRDIMRAIESVALSISRVESAMEFMRLTVVSHGHQIATLEAKINNVESRVAALEASRG